MFFFWEIVDFSGKLYFFFWICFCGKSSIFLGIYGVFWEIIEFSRQIMEVSGKFFIFLGNYGVFYRNYGVFWEIDGDFVFCFFW